MKKVRMLTFCTLLLTVALFAAAGRASAEGPPTVRPLEAICTAAGGLFFGSVFFENRAVCDSNINAGIVLSEPFISAARNLCLNAYNADFFVVSGPPGFPTWNCGWLRPH
jgi:hypothetical protein